MARRQFGRPNPFERPNPFDRNFPQTRGGTPTPLVSTTVARNVPTASPMTAGRGASPTGIDDRRFRGGALGDRYGPQPRQFERIQYGPPPHYGVYAPPYVTPGPLGERHFRMPTFDIPLPPPQMPAGGTAGWGGGAGGAGGATAPPGQAAVEPVPITWSEFDYRPKTAPGWWKAMKPSEIDPQTEYLSSVNMMIPFLSQEDQMTVASQLYITDPKNFAHLNPEKIKDYKPGSPLPPIPGRDEKASTAPRGEPRTRRERAFFMGQERANEALIALTKLREATGKEETDFGPGYHFLRSLVTTVGRYGAEAPVGRGDVPDLMTRQQAVSLMGALDPMLAMGRSEPISAYGPIAQSFGSPFFSRRALMPMAQTEEGRYMFGRPNPMFRF
jgi:hypothetical protein